MWQGIAAFIARYVSYQLNSQEWMSRTDWLDDDVTQQSQLLLHPLIYEEADGNEHRKSIEDRPWNDGPGQRLPAALVRYPLCYGTAGVYYRLLCYESTGTTEPSLHVWMLVS